VAGFVIGSGIGLYRFRQEMRKPIDEDAPHPEDAFRVPGDEPRPDPEPAETPRTDGHADPR
jgi:hypothetical protein